MAIHTTAAKDALCNGIKDTIDADLSAGTIKLYLANETTLVSTVVLQYPCGVVSGGVLTFSTTMADSGAVGNASPVAHFKVTDNSGDEVFSGTVTGIGGGGEIELDDTTIDNGDTVTITSLTWTAPS